VANYLAADLPRRCELSVQAVALQLKRVSAAKVVVTLAEPGNGARSE
jgi:hypothetical protein